MFPGMVNDMNYHLFYMSITMTASIIAFILGLFFMLRNKRGYFFSFCVFGLFSFTVGHTFYVLLELTGNDSFVFSLGSLGVISGLLCISFACNAINKIDEEENIDLKKYNKIANAAPAFMIICWIAMFIFKVGFERMIIATLFLFSALPCSFYSLRNAIIPYSKKSLNGNLNPFFAVVLVFCIAEMLSEASWIISGTSAAGYVDFIIFIIVSVCNILMPVMLERGYRKWMKI